MGDAITIQPVSGPVQTVVRPPGSKSITNRALVCAALAGGRSVLSGALASDDTRVMIDSLNALGIPVSESQLPESDAGTTLTVEGAGGRIPAGEAELLIGNSGTTVRFLTAMVALGEGRYRLDGVPRMRERPIGDLVDALNALGGNVVSELGTGCPPLVVEGPRLAGGRAAVRGNISSQYLSGLLMAMPCAAGPVTLEVAGELVSRPYVDMTLRVMEEFGVSVEMADGGNRFASPGGACYQPREYAIEPDASAASYFWALAAITGGEVTVEGLSRQSLQGDVAFVDVLEQMGCEVMHHADSITVRGAKTLRGITVDMNAISDTVQTLAPVALFADGPTRVTGVAHNRHKETDRIGDLATELRKLGAEVEEFEDGLEIRPRALQGAVIETYDDHRMAMGLSLVGLRVPGVEITNPGCTAKTYPHFFSDLQTATATCRGA